LTGSHYAYFDGASATISYSLETDAITPAEVSSLKGGQEIIITGNGFVADVAFLQENVVKVCG